MFNLIKMFSLFFIANSKQKPKSQYTVKILDKLERPNDNIKNNSDAVRIVTKTYKYIGM